MKLIDADLIADCLRGEMAKNEDDKSVTGMLAKGVLKHLIGLMEDLPAVQPEVIRCKECKYSEHWYKDKRRCFLWNAGIDVFEDGYCNYAERKDNG